MTPATMITEFNGQKYLTETDFIKWDTLDYEYPGDPNDLVEVVDKGGFRRIGLARKFYWFYQDWTQDVVKYRGVKKIIY